MNTLHSQLLLHRSMSGAKGHRWRAAHRDAERPDGVVAEGREALRLPEERHAIAGAATLPREHALVPVAEAGPELPQPDLPDL